MSGRKKYRVLFVGSKTDSAIAYAFAMIGMDTIIVDRDELVLERLGDIIEEEGKYAVIIIPERFIEATRYLREKIREKMGFLPAFIFLPDVREPKFGQIAELEELLQRALGVTMKLSK